MLKTATIPIDYVSILIPHYYLSDFKDLVRLVFLSTGMWNIFVCSGSGTYSILNTVDLVVSCGGSGSRL